MKVAELQNDLQVHRLSYSVYLVHFNAMISNEGPSMLSEPITEFTLFPKIANQAGKIRQFYCGLYLESLQLPSKVQANNPSDQRQL